MVSVKLKFKPSSKSGKEGRLFYQLICNRIVRQISIQYKIFPEEWNAETGFLNIAGSDPLRRKYLLTAIKHIQREKNQLFEIASEFSKTGRIHSADSIVRAFNEKRSNETLFNYIGILIQRLQKNGQIRTGETYASTLNSFKRFRNGEDIHFFEIDSELMVAYENYLKMKGVSRNTVSFYMRRLRAIYNKAADEGLVEQSFPFKRVFTSAEKTLKRAIPVKYIRSLKTMDLRSSSAKSFARDMFLFSFYTRGMSFVDIAFLRKNDLKSGMLTYRRKKTGQLMFIQWEPCMQYILNRYKAEPSSPYLLSIIKAPYENPRRQYHNTLTKVNRSLKDIGKKMGLPTPLSMYVARHSWASIARNEGIPISIISEGMGHNSESTTRIYLASLDTAKIDKANHKILSLI